MKLQTPKGFKDSFGKELRLKRKIINTLTSIFESYGYEPLETPSIEYAETILGKYGQEAEKLVYKFKDQGERDLALIYEMTTSACRFVAQNYSKINFPFKRYQIQKAFRAEKPQRGRLREFTQCDADIWGEREVSADAEFIQMGIKAMLELGFKDFSTKISNRKILNAIAKYAGIPESKFYNLTVSIDKLEKVGKGKVYQEMIKRGIKKQEAEKALEIIGQKYTDFTPLKRYFSQIKEGLAGISELEEIFKILKTEKVNEKYYQFSPSIVRGLAYYTGPVWEIDIKEGNIGSVAGAGRFDKLTKALSGIDIPATGGSFGVERLSQVISERNPIEVPQSIVKVLVTVFSPELVNQSRKVAQTLRNKKINTELYLNPNEKLKKQLKYASNKKIPFVVVIGPDEAKENKVTLKDMNSGKQSLLKVEFIPKRIS